MDPTKKRKLDDNGVVLADTEISHRITPEDARKIIERFSPDQLLDILQHAVVRHPDVLDAVRSVADADPTQRKLFIRGLGWETTTEKLRDLFASYGELEEAVVILDKNTGKSKGYGFVIYRHVDGAVLALKEPSKKIDGRVTVTQLASLGNSGGGGNGNSNAVDVAARKIYVANVPMDMPSDKLLAHFAQYGEIEEGPLGFDKLTGKSKGFALFVYKTAEGAQAALVEPVKMVDGRQLNCKLAIDGKKGKPGGGGGGGPGQVGQDIMPGGPGSMHGEGMGMGIGQQGPYGGPGGMSGYGGYSGGMPPMGGHHHPMNSSMGGPGLVAQAPGSFAGSGGYGAAGGGAGGMGGPYGGYGGPGSTGYGGFGGSAGPGAGGVGGGSSFYRMPPNSGGMPPGGYAEGGPYGLSSSSVSFPSQHQGTSPAPRVPPGGGMYPSFSTYY